MTKETEHLFHGNGRSSIKPTLETGVWPATSLHPASQRQTATSDSHRLISSRDDERCVRCGRRARRGW